MVTGILLPHETLFTDWFGILTAFVAVNTIMYVTLAIAKIFPRWRFTFLRRRNTRAETRSIHPDAPVGGPRPVTPRARRTAGRRSSVGPGSDPARSRPPGS